MDNKVYLKRGHKVINNEVCSFVIYAGSSPIMWFVERDKAIQTAERLRAKWEVQIDDNV